MKKGTKIWKKGQFLDISAAYEDLLFKKGVIMQVKFGEKTPKRGVFSPKRGVFSPFSRFSAILVDFNRFRVLKSQQEKNPKDLRRSFTKKRSFFGLFLEKRSPPACKTTFFSLMRYSTEETPFSLQIHVGQINPGKNPIVDP